MTVVMLSKDFLYIVIPEKCEQLSSKFHTRAAYPFLSFSSICMQLLFQVYSPPTVTSLVKRTCTPVAV